MIGPTGGERPCGRRGFSLVDIVVLIFIVTLVIIPLMSVFPMSRLCVKKAEDLQTAVYLAQRSMNHLRASIPSSLDSSNDGDPLTVDDHFAATETINDKVFSIVRDVYGVRDEPDPADASKRRVALLDVVVQVEWPGMQSPLVLTTRVSRAYLDLQKDLIVKSDPNGPTPNVLPTGGSGR